MEDRFGSREPGTGWASAQADDIARAVSDVGMWDYDIASGRLAWDRRTAELRGVDVESWSVGGTMEAFFALIHPDDVQAVRAAVDAAIQTCGSYLAEFRVVRPDGSQAWNQTLGKVVSSSAGHATRMIGLVVDSTLRRSMVETLQRAILPPTLPDLPGMAIAARYLPASHALGIGGDWYSCDVHANGPLSLVVGDVAGHGLAAVAAMAELRHTARGYGLAGYSPAAITTQLSANLRASPGTVEEIDADTEGTLATTIVAQLALDTRRLTWSCAGHPPPLLIVGTDAAYLDNVHGPMLGVDPALAYGQSTLDLPPGARLLLYTDGLVERRGTSITHGLDTLAATASDNPQQGADGLDHLCDRILADVAGPADQEDDICLLAIQTP